ncbi:MAG: type II toxin-antitoxin system HicB family antitoxin [Spirochaetota bacterium]|nr:MAG: type II toxin-antitoxin system HicB family antitoxin [Spirochaetota bacterium]
MLMEYSEEALKRAHYESIDDEEPYYGEVKELKGIWAAGRTLEDCRNSLREVIEGWIVVSVKRGLPIPKLGHIEIKEIEKVSM